MTGAQLRFPFPQTSDWRLDEHTREVGRRGLVEARAALDRCRQRGGRDPVPRSGTSPMPRREGQCGGPLGPTSRKRRQRPQAPPVRARVNEVR